MVAGSGDLPVHVGAEAQKRGFLVVVVAFEGFTSPSIENSASKVCWMKLGQVNKAIEALKTNGVSRVVMA